MGGLTNSNPELSLFTANTASAVFDPVLLAYATEAGSLPVPASLFVNHCPFPTVQYIKH